MKNPKVVIIDYGMGNLFSLQRVVSYLGGVGIISSDPEVIAFAQRLILPGVGAFGDGITNLQKRNLVEPIKNAIRSAKPFLGICLGIQLCMTESYEFGLHKG
ncbi:MAG: imidazole glycerol phosphate synthase subunit HisH, partial [bacterium]